MQWINKLNKKICLIVFVAALILAAVMFGLLRVPPEQQLSETLEQKNYAEAVEIYRDSIEGTNAEETFRDAIVTLLTQSVEQWESGDSSYEETILILQGICELDDPELAEQASQSMAFVEREAQCDDLLATAKSQRASGEFAAALSTLAEIDPDYSRLHEVEREHTSCVKGALRRTAEPSSEEEFDQAINLLEACLEVTDDADLSQRKDSLNEERKIWIAVSSIIDSADGLYQQEAYEESFFVLTLGLEEYPDNPRLGQALVDFTDHYIIQVSQQVTQLCDEEEYRSAVNVLDAAIEEYDCTDFHTLRETVRQKQSILQRLSYDAVQTFVTMTEDFDVEPLDVKQATIAAGEYVTDSGEKLFLGDYSEEEMTVLAFSGNIVAALSGLDVLFDLRDLSYDVVHWGEDEYFALNLATDVVALLPIGGVLKYIRHLEIASDGVKGAVKLADSAADVSSDTNKFIDFFKPSAETAKKVEQIADNMDEAKNVSRLSESVKDALKNITKNYETLDINKNCRDYLGKTYKDTGIEVRLSKQKYSDGRKVALIMPKFKSFSDVQLPKNLYTASTATQKAHCLKELQKQIERPFSGIKKNFTEEQLEMIMNGKIPSEYVWHHNEKEGLMQLVLDKDHRAISHTGGNALWGPKYANKLLEDAQKAASSHNFS